MSDQGELAQWYLMWSSSKAQSKHSKRREVSNLVRVRVKVVVIVRTSIITVTLQSWKTDLSWISDAQQERDVLATLLLMALTTLALE